MLSLARSVMADTHKCDQLRPDVGKYPGYSIWGFPQNHRESQISSFNLSSLYLCQWGSRRKSGIQDQGVIAEPIRKRGNLTLKPRQQQTGEYFFNPSEHSYSEAQTIRFQFHQASRFAFFCRSESVTYPKYRAGPFGPAKNWWSLLQI